jgi:hypothetical protein
LPFHEAGKEKWRQCGIEYRQAEAYVPEETRKLFEAAFQNQQLQVVHT